MKKLIKITLVVIVGFLLFTTGAFAANQGWLNFTGDEQVEQSECKVNEVMEILRNVYKGKTVPEQAVVELRKLDPLKIQKDLQKAHKALEEAKTCE